MTLTLSVASRQAEAASMFLNLGKSDCRSQVFSAELNILGRIFLQEFGVFCLNP